MTASPVASFWSDAPPPPTTTSPVLMPVRVTISTPWSRCEVGVQLSKRVLDLGRRADGAERVVLANGGHPEHGHDRVADELLHRAAVALERGLDGLEVPPHDVAKELRVEALAEGRRAGDVGEQDRDDLAR